MNSHRNSLPVQKGFFGRRGTVRNILDGIRKGASFCISGGPSIGKTALLHHLTDRLRTENPPKPGLPYRPVFLSFRELGGGKVGDIANRLYSRLDTAYPKGLGRDRFILCLDDCEALIEPAHSDVLENLLSPSGKTLLGRPWSVLWAGGERWYRKCLNNRFRHSHSLRLVPLSVFTEKETREIVRSFSAPSLSQDRYRTLREQTGGHPYLLSMMLDCWKTDPQRSEKEVLNACRPEWETWAERCREALQHEGENEKAYGKILEYLIDRKKPVNPSEVGQAAGLRDIKPYLDTLCRLGICDRTLRDGEAAVQTGCGFFNRWYKQIVNPVKEC